MRVLGRHQKGRRANALPLCCRAIVLGLAVGCDTPLTAGTEPDSIATVPFSGSYDLLSIDGQPLPDTLDLQLSPASAVEAHRVQGSTMQFTVSPLASWSVNVQRVSGGGPGVLALQFVYQQIGDSLRAGSSFAGLRYKDTLAIDVNGESALGSRLGGSHTWRFVKEP